MIFLMPSANRLAAVDAYIAKSQPFAQPILAHLRELVHQAVPQAEEAIKWSRPFFTYKGIILANLAAFKAHASFGVWSNQENSLRKEGVEARGGGMGSFGKLKSLEDLPKDKELKAFLVEAVRRIDSGERDANWRRPAEKKKSVVVKVPAALAAAFEKNKVAAAQFQAMSPSAQREYCEWIGEAKRDETREKRLAEAIPWIAEGKQRHWKYQAAKKP